MTPDGAGPFPAVLLLHTSGGLQPGDIEYGKRLVAEGYVVVVPSFLAAYGIQARTRQETFTSKAQPIYADFAATLEQMRKDPKVDGRRVAAIGFSNGGYFAMWLAATGQVQGGVSYYGALSGAGTDTSLTRFRNVFNEKSSPVLILHGTADSTVRIGSAITLDSILDGTKSPREFHQYAGAEHRFERDSGTANEAAALDAWNRTLDFLKTKLK